MILTVLYLALPAFVANVMPILATPLRLWPRLAYPVNERFLGSHKTWRGLVVGMVFGSLTALVQWLVWMPYEVSLSWALLFGFLAGTGAILGDMAKSLVKRAVGIPSGGPFIPFDQIDYIIGMVACTLPLYPWSVEQVGILLIFVLIANPIVSTVSYFLGIKKTFW